jgi:hypothetical protein
LRLVTFNVWFAEHYFDERAKAMLRLLEACDADLIGAAELHVFQMARGFVNRGGADRFIDRLEEWFGADKLLQEPGKRRSKGGNRPARLEAP